MLAEAVVLLGASGGVVSLWDDEHAVLVPIRNTIPTSAGDARPAAGQAASARAVERRAPVLLNDYQRYAEAAEVGALAAVAAPLLHEDHLLGAVALVSHAAGKQFVPADAEVLQQIADIGAAAIVGLDRARLQRAIGPAEVTALDRGPAGPHPANVTHIEAHLPPQPTPLIGRDAELDQAAELVLRPDVSLLTLAGPAGSARPGWQ